MIEAMPSGHAGTTDVTDSIRSPGRRAPRHHDVIAAEDQFAAHKAVQHGACNDRRLCSSSACQLRPAAAEAADPLTGLGTHHVNRLAGAELAAQGPDVTVGV